MSQTLEHLRASLKSLIADAAFISADELTDETELIDSGLVDSETLTEIEIVLESHLPATDISSEISRTDLENINSIVKFVELRSQ